MDFLLSLVNDLNIEKEERYRKDTVEHNKLRNLFFDERKVEAILERIINLKNYDHGEVHTVEFEFDHNWDILIRDVQFIKCECDWNKKNNGDECDCKYKDSETQYRPNIYIDLVPTIGEDYGSILRMLKRKIKLIEYDNEKNFEKDTGKTLMESYIKNHKIDASNHSYHGEYILLVDKLETESITRENLKEMYSSDIKVIFLDEIKFYADGEKPRWGCNKVIYNE